MDGLARAKNIKISTEMKKIPDIFADTQKMERIIINLLGNAIKLTKSNGTVCIQSYKKGNFIVFAIQDTGPGIAKQDLRKIFNMFNIGDSSNISGKGHGLGLAITKSFVEMHGGTIFVKSERHKGSTFIIHLPIEKRLESIPSVIGRKMAVLDLAQDFSELKSMKKYGNCVVDYFRDEKKLVKKVKKFILILISEEELEI